MSTEMKLFHEIMSAAEPAPYWAFAIETTYCCDHCDENHVDSHRYIVAEVFCPTPDCMCREVVLSVMYLDDDQVATSIADTVVDLDDAMPRKIRWINSSMTRDTDERALQQVEERLRGDPSYRQTLAEHWTQVGKAKRAATNAKQSSRSAERRQLQKKLKAKQKRKRAQRRG
ncbi:MAG: hypothetical protein HYV60_19110 [Planctomycetia bacterium]|nr:hypothetical protein [Planctomycetia bacterium]